ncbi:hypothetical protein GLAREA_08095 [Glarea lozoyensis ATCC 20868]|uniref:DUF7730 domain-containing protein n=1 Tax=Glarea lozoyensis (strain ATCC 20868 / MF5171) TaxID=1116229 RepID=S3CG67_GLAL2|nr:uncharacterized protein GLAREA_08095 [Glarea lozoyensis ATCC 20868]EPE24244.1 hypothetical protein GLAREA_08095 [Glarea lozoyensis ATCC 20868]
MEDWEKLVPSYNPGTDIKRRRLSFDGKIQTQSVLWKLPLEIRQQIYAECVSGYNIRVTLNTIDDVSGFNRKESRRFMQHTRCKLFPVSTCLSCFSIQKRNRGLDEWGVGSLLSLLKVCRRIYVEAIPILYSQNTFTFERTETILQLSMSILPQRMELIKRVSWTCDHKTYNVHMPWLYCKEEEKGDCACIRCLPNKFKKDRSLIPSLVMLNMIDQEDEELVAKT